MPQPPGRLQGQVKSARNLPQWGGASADVDSERRAYQRSGVVDGSGLRWLWLRGCGGNCGGDDSGAGHVGARHPGHALWVVATVGSLT
jgi:hypothetical protein